MGISNSGNWRLARNIILAGFLVNLVICLFNFFVLDLEYPNTTFLFRPLDRFQDFYTVLRGTIGLDPYRIQQVVNVPGHGGIEVSNYFPLTHLVFYPFTLVDPEIALGIFLAIFFAGLIYGVWRVLRGIPVEERSKFAFSIFVFSALTYPVLFAADRGNLECWVFLLCALGIYLFSSQRFKTGAVVIALAAGIKAFPLLLLFPLIKQKRIGPLILAGLIFVVTNFIALAFFTGTVESNLESMRIAFFSFNSFLLLGVNGITHSISIFSAIYSTKLLINDELVPEAVLAVWRDKYGVFAAISLSGILATIWFKRMAHWMQWALLIGAIQVLPFPSYDYKLLYSLIPLAFLALDKSDDPRQRKFVWLLSLTIIPKVFALFLDVRVGTVLNPLLIIATIMLILFEPAPPETAKSPNGTDPRHLPRSHRRQSGRGRK